MEPTLFKIKSSRVLGFKIIAETINVALWWRAELLLVIAAKVRRGPHSPLGIRRSRHPFLRLASNVELLVGEGAFETAAGSCAPSCRYWHRNMFVEGKAQNRAAGSEEMAPQPNRSQLRRNFKRS